MDVEGMVEQEAFVAPTLESWLLPLCCYHIARTTE